MRRTISVAVARRESRLRVLFSRQRVVEQRPDAARGVRHSAPDPARTTAVGHEPAIGTVSLGLERTLVGEIKREE
jgi:hypothetical protein